MENTRKFNTSDYWELEKTVMESIGVGTEVAEFAYVINRLTGEVKKTRVG